jgi:hypothetical protein
MGVGYGALLPYVIEVESPVLSAPPNAKGWFWYQRPSDTSTYTI